MNVGSAEEICIRQLAEFVAETVGYRGNIVWDTSKPNGQPRRHVDVSRAEELFGFRAATPLRQGLKQTVDWYLQHAREKAHM